MEAAEADDDPVVEIRSICVVDNALPIDDPVLDSLSSAGLTVSFISWSRGDNAVDLSAVYVLPDFEGATFEELHKREACLLGPPAIREMVRRGQRPTASGRPLYCTSMEGLGVCFNSHRKRNKAELTRYFLLIHSMGGSILKDMTTSRVTHLVADSCRGEKYRYASTFGIPIMAGSWLEAAWARRKECRGGGRGFRADDKDFQEAHKVRPFHGASIHFLGFTEEERQHMVEELERNGGKECRDPSGSGGEGCHHPCTHIVVDDSRVSNAAVAAASTAAAAAASTSGKAPTKDLRPETPAVVKSEWFWASIQMDACAEEKLHVLSVDNHYQHQFAASSTSFLSPQGPAEGSGGPQQQHCGPSTPNNRSLFSPGTPGSAGGGGGSSSNNNSSRKRKRRREAVSQLAQSEPLQLTVQQLEKRSPSQVGHGGAVPAAVAKRRSSVTELGSFLLDCSGVDTGRRSGGTPAAVGGCPAAPGSATVADALHQKRQQHGPLAGDGVTSPAAGSPLKKQLPDLKALTARQQVFHELVQTETNYVNILQIILDVFKKPLEDPKMIGGQLVNQTELKIMFGNVLPIYEVHSRMLAEFAAAIHHWRDDFTVGTVYLRYANDLLKAYPPFINFFEESKRTILECDKNNPRFHAFLKVCQSKPECRRQTLAELMIRPVQRLPSVILLLTDLLKHTRKEKDHRDVAALEAAIAKVKEVMTNINEDKRKTEGQVCIFEIFSDIENCPAHLVSSHRSFMCKVDVTELGGSDELCGKGYELSLFLFSDVLEVSKKRSNASKGLGLKSPSTMSLRNVGLGPHGGLGGGVGGGGGCGGGGGGAGSLANESIIGGKDNVGGVLGGGRALKHINLMSLSSVKRVVDVYDADVVGSGNVFALVCRTNQELKERMFVFQIVSDDVDKATFLRTLCRNIANTMCRQDPDIYLRQMRSDELGLDPSDLSLSNFGSRAYRSLHRKVNRAFSFNKTPTGRLKRAVSSMISPITQREHRYHGGVLQPSSSNLIASGTGVGGGGTPSGDFQNLRLASCSNLLHSGVVGIAEYDATDGSSGGSPHDGGSAKSRRQLRHSHQSASMMPPPSMPAFAATSGPFGGTTPKRGMASSNSMLTATTTTAGATPPPARPPAPPHNFDEMLEEALSSSGSSANVGKGLFNLPKTPTLPAAKCSRRPSFKFKGPSSILGGGGKSNNK